MKRARYMFHSWFRLILLGAILTIAATDLSGCKEPETQDLSFETIAQGENFKYDDGKDYQGEQPNLIVITDSKVISDPGLDIVFSTDVLTQLSAWDYSQSFVVLVLQGQRKFSASGDIVTATQVQRQGNRVVIHARFTSMPPTGIVMEGVTSPYHLISVTKDDSWDTTIHFVLMNGDEAVAESRHFVP